MNMPESRAYYPRSVPFGTFNEQNGSDKAWPEGRLAPHPQASEEAPAGGDKFSDFQPSMVSIAKHGFGVKLTTLATGHRTYPNARFSAMKSTEAD